MYTYKYTAIGMHLSINLSVVKKERVGFKQSYGSLNQTKLALNQ